MYIAAKLSERWLIREGTVKEIEQLSEDGELLLVSDSHGDIVRQIELSGEAYENVVLGELN